MSLMLEEAQSAPECLRAQWQANADTLAEFGYFGMIWGCSSTAYSTAS
ncbi:hypothetical protein R3F72_09435 [Salinicola sp. 4072]|jgi:hypothetical protein